MPAYFVLTQTITDLDRYQKEYIPGVLPFLAKHGGEVVVADMDAERAEGDPAAGVVVVRFPDEKAARNFLSDPDYRPLQQLRFSITEKAAAVIAPEFSPPSN